MEVPWPGIGSELALQPMPQLQQCWILSPAAWGQSLTSGSTETSQLMNTTALLSTKQKQPLTASLGQRKRRNKSCSKKTCSGCEGWTWGDLPDFGASACKNVKWLKIIHFTGRRMMQAWIDVNTTLSAAHFGWWFQTLPEIVLHSISVQSFFPLMDNSVLCNMPVSQKPWYEKEAAKILTMTTYVPGESWWELK